MSATLLEKKDFLRMDPAGLEKGAEHKHVVPGWEDLGGRGYEIQTLVLLAFGETFRGPRVEIRRMSFGERFKQGRDVYGLGIVHDQVKDELFKQGKDGFRNVAQSFSVGRRGFVVARVLVVIIR